ARNAADRAVAMSFADWGIPTLTSVQAVRRALPVACFCTGSADLAALRQARLLPSSHLSAG
ncbi:MAG: type 2 isopentenyl-diphosphate Delta-isomerase, partial [Mesorhizobium sp.]